MPAIQRFKVQQIREVEISASSLQDAVVMATRAFENFSRPVRSPEGSAVVRDVRETHISAEVI